LVGVSAKLDGYVEERQRHHSGLRILRGGLLVASAGASMRHLI
jgi:hypothetical protein